MSPEGRWRVLPPSDATGRAVAYGSWVAWQQADPEPVVTGEHGFEPVVTGDTGARRRHRTRQWLWRRPYRMMLAIGIIQVYGTAAAGDRTPGRLDLVLHGHRLPNTGLLLLVVAAAALPLSKPSPRAMLVAATVPTVAYFGLGFPDGPGFLAMMLAASVAITRGYRRFAWVTVVAGYLGYLLLTLGLHLDLALGAPPVTPGRAASVGLWAAACLGFAEALRIRAVRAAEAAQLLAEQRKAAAERERAEVERSRAEVERTRAEVQHSRAEAEQARRQASEERLRIAGELHDVIGHHLSLINVQASVGLHLMDQQPQQARDSLAAIKSASAEALRETRAVLATLQATATAPRAPTPGVADLDRLVGEAAAAGLPVTLSATGDLGTLPPALDMAVYRTVREALTNVRRHAGTVGAVAVNVGIGGGVGGRRLEVEVVDDGQPVQPASDGRPVPIAGRAAADEPGGTGLAGMSARATALGGCVEAGTLPAGGFRVRATFPLDDEEQQV